MVDASLLWNELVGSFSDWMAPTLARLHLYGTEGDRHAVAEAVVIGAFQLGVIALIFSPLERLAPDERWTHRRGTRVDVQYTVLMLVGILPLFSYLVMAPLAHLLTGSETSDAQNLVGLKSWVPWLGDHPLLMFLVYYVVYDCAYYVMHRMQHSIPWWWALHSMHHSQRQVSCWTNDRGSYLDAVLQSFILATVGLAMGVEPDEFALLVMLGELVQSFSHANVKIRFGPVLEKFFVGPLFHRLHHMRADPARPGFHNCNFGQVFPVWDIVFGTALYGETSRPTGVCDPVVDADHECGLVGQQCAALRRFWGAFRRRSGWMVGDVSFGPDYAPIASIHAFAPQAGAPANRAVHGR